MITFKENYLFLKYYMKNLFSQIYLPLILFSFTSCATVMNRGASQIVPFSSTPFSLKCIIKDLTSGDVLFEGKTPFSIPLSRTTGFFSKGRYSATFYKNGREVTTRFIEGKASGWYIFGNLFLGGFLGWVLIDPLTGAMWTLSPDKVHVNAGEYASNLNVLHIDDLPKKYRKDLKKVYPLTKNSKVQSEVVGS